MAQNGLRAPDRPGGPNGEDRLDSWKEIGAYLKRDVTTVRRWEKREALPVHRHSHERRDSVYAYRSEIDAWWGNRSNHLAGNGIENETASTMRVGLAWGLAATFFVATLVLAGLLASEDRSGPSDRPGEIRFSIAPPAGNTFGSIAVSPNGALLAFTAAPSPPSNGRSLLWIRPLDAVVARALRETEDATFPFWSPASDAVGFFAAGKLWVVDVSKGTPRALCDAPSGRGGTWNRDGTIVFAPTSGGPLFRVPSSGGTPAPVTTLKSGEEQSHVWPEFLPDGRRFLYLADANANALDRHGLYVGSLDGMSPLRVMSIASNAIYSEIGYLVFARDRQLHAQRFDPDRLMLSGEASVLADSVQEQAGLGHKTDFSVSAGGVLVYRTMQSPATRLVWRDRDRRTTPMIDAPAEHYEPVLSPDGTRVAFALFDPRPSKRFGFGVIGVRSDIWIHDRSSGTSFPFTSDPAAEWGPVWSPDGRRIVFSSNRRGELELFEKTTDGGSHEQPLATSGTNPVAQSWSPDGALLVYAAFDPATRGDLWILPMSGDRTVIPLLRSEFTEEQGQISPDGRWIAFTSGESGREEVYVQRFPKAAGKWRVSADGGADPRWRPDGREVFYVASDRRLMAVPVTPRDEFDHGVPVPLFDTGAPPHWYETRNLYDVSRDGRFLLMSPAEEDRSMPLTVVINWMRRLGG